jgi:hypothetical protein
MLDVAADVLRVASLAMASHRFKKLGRQIYRLADDLMEGRADDLVMRDVPYLEERTTDSSVEGYWPPLMTKPNREA